VEIITYFASEWHVIWGAPVTFITAAVLLMAAAYAAASWRFGGVMDSQRAQIEFLQKRLDAIPGGADSERKKAIRAQISLFMNRAERLMERYVQGPEDLSEPNDAVLQWRTELMSYVDKNLDDSYKARIFSDSGLISGQPTSISGDRLGRWVYLNYRAIRLQQIVKEFS